MCKHTCRCQYDLSPEFHWFWNPSLTSWYCINSLWECSFFRVHAMNGDGMIIGKVKVSSRPPATNWGNYAFQDSGSCRRAGFSQHPVLIQLFRSATACVFDAGTSYTDLMKIKIFQITPSQFKQFPSWLASKQSSLSIRVKLTIALLICAVFTPIALLRIRHFCKKKLCSKNRCSKFSIAWIRKANSLKVCSISLRVT